MSLSEVELSRFLAKVNKTDSCWIWTACTTKAGYGLFYSKKKLLLAHRISLAHHLGRPIVEGMMVAHAPLVCHNPTCVNPEHLREVTGSENQEDRRVDGTMIMGAAHSSAKLTEEQVRQIRTDTRSQRVIATDYGICQATVGEIKRRKIWKSLQ